MSIRTRTLGKSELVVSELGLGTWGLTSEGYGVAHEVDWTLDRARELGITLFETSTAYASPDQESFESKFGRIFENDPTVVLCIRAGNDLESSPPRKRFDQEYLKASAHQSAEKTRRKPDLYLLNHPLLHTLQQGEATQTLEELVQKNVIKSWGVACADKATLSAAIKAGAHVVEVAYNILKTRDLHSLAGEILSARVGVLARSVLAYGLLCGVWSTEKIFLENDHRRDRWTQEERIERIQQVNALRVLVHDDIHTTRAVALRYVLANQLVGSAIVGVRNASQLESNVRAIGDGPPYLPMNDLANLPKILRDVGIEE